MLYSVEGMCADGCAEGLGQVAALVRKVLRISMVGALFVVVNKVVRWETLKASRCCAATSYAALHSNPL